MTRSFFEAVAHRWGIGPVLVDLACAADELTTARCALIRERGALNFLRVLAAFQRAGVSEAHLVGTTGYGYDDLGREGLDQIYAELLGAEAALVRVQMVSGTHALSLALRAAAGPGDVLVAGTGRPYDSLWPQVEDLRSRGLRYVEVRLGSDGRVSTEAVAGAVGEAAIAVRKSSMAGRAGRMAGLGGRGGRVCLFLQRSCGYDLVPSRPVSQLEALIARAHEEADSAGVELVSLVDNCYGELVEEREPCAAGADLVAGSLIKNPGGGLAPTGGYVAGRADLVHQAAEFLTAPGLGAKVGPTLGLSRLLYQGLFLAPRAVAAGLAGATFAAAFLESLGFAVLPSWSEDRTDTIQGVALGSREAVLAFARGIQAAAPVDARATPVGAPLPGYADPVVMAAGTFIQGASSELSLDAPLRPPYAAYLQGGLDEAHLRAAVVLAAAELERRGLLGAL